MTGPTVAIAVSGHGYGHAVRCAEVARELLERGARVVIRSEAPRWLFPETLEWIANPGWPIDVGVAQHDGLEMDIDATRCRWTDFARHFDDRTQAEAQLLTQHQVDFVIGDVPPLAFAAAARAGIPSAALTNFGWDWIYAAWPAFDTPIARVRTGYEQAGELLRLPLHSSATDAFPAFQAVTDVPLIARHARQARHSIRAELGLRDSARVVLLSFGGFNARGIDLHALGQWPDYTFVLTPPLATAESDLPANVMALAQAPPDYVSLLGACDAVVTKPGYGMVADCLANRVAMLYTDRGPFREYDVLADALPRLGQARYAPRSDVLNGGLGPHLDRLLQAPGQWADLRLDGGSVVAEHVLQRVPPAGNNRYRVSDDRDPASQAT